MRAMDVGAVKAPTIQRSAMQTIATIGLDIAKSVFQVHGVDTGGQVIVRRQLKRRYVLTFFQKLSPCLVGIEACCQSGLDWAPFRRPIPRRNTSRPKTAKQ